MIARFVRRMADKIDGLLADRLQKKFPQNRKEASPAADRSTGHTSAHAEDVPPGKSAKSTGPEIGGGGGPLFVPYEALSRSLVTESRSVAERLRNDRCVVCGEEAFPHRVRVCEEHEGNLERRSPRENADPLVERAAGLLLSLSDACERGAAALTPQIPFSLLDELRRQPKSDFLDAPCIDEEFDKTQPAESWMLVRPDGHGELRYLVGGHGPPWRFLDAWELFEERIQPKKFDSRADCILLRQIYPDALCCLHVVIDHPGTQDSRQESSSSSHVDDEQPGPASPLTDLRLAVRAHYWAERSDTLGAAGRLLVGSPTDYQRAIAAVCVRAYAGENQAWREILARLPSESREQLLRDAEQQRRAWLDWARKVGPSKQEQVPR